MCALLPDHEAWLRQFARAVRDRDFAAVRELFDEQVDAFGTVSVRARGLEELQAQQWSRVWPKTRGFDFEYGTAVSIQQGVLVVVLASWSSVGLGAGGVEFPRRGRATIVLRMLAGGGRAVHTHFSMEPDDPLLRRLQ